MAQIYKLTALQIKNAKPKEKEYSINDGRGLYVRIYPNGTKSFCLQQLINGKRVRCNLGLVGEMSLENARNIAEQKIAQTKLTPAEYGKIVTFRDVMIEYLEYKKDSWSPRMLSQFNNAYKAFYHKLDKKPIAEIRRRDILNLLDLVIKRGKKEYFNHLKIFLSVFFGWAVQKEYCEHNIIRDIEIKYLFAPKKEKASSIS